MWLFGSQPPLCLWPTTTICVVVLAQQAQLVVCCVGTKNHHYVGCGSGPNHRYLCSGLGPKPSTCVWWFGTNTTAICAVVWDKKPPPCVCVVALDQHHQYVLCGFGTNKTTICVVVRDKIMCVCLCVIWWCGANRNYLASVDIPAGQLLMHK